MIIHEACETMMTHYECDSMVAQGNRPSCCQNQGILQLELAGPSCICFEKRCLRQKAKFKEDGRDLIHGLVA
jgi:hypothetical protein